MGTTFQQQSTLMGLPLEIRNEILGHLLPNLSEIKVFDGYHDKTSVCDALGEECSDFDDLSPDDLSLRVAELVQYRGDGEACHTAILRASRQLYIEGATIMYNRAFRVVVGAKEFTFLRRRFQWQWPTGGSILDLGQMYSFPFHMAKQIQIEIWATNFNWSIRYLTDNVLDLCVILHQKPSLRSVRVDLWDRQHRPVPSSNRSDCMVDGARPCPLQEKFRGRIFSEPSDGGCFPLPYDQYGRLCDVWEHVVPYWSTRYDLVSPPASDGLKEALEPLKLLRNVGRVNINLTAESEKDQGMMAVAKNVQDSMMRPERDHETELNWKSWSENRLQHNGERWLRR